MKGSAPLAIVVSLAIICTFIMLLCEFPRPMPVRYEAPTTELLRAEIRREMARQLSLASARAQYPDLLQPDSALLVNVRTREDALREAGDDLLDSPDYPLILTQQEAAKLGILPVNSIRLQP